MGRRKPASAILRTPVREIGLGLFFGDSDVPELGDLVDDGSEAVYGKLAGAFAFEGFHLRVEGGSFAEHAENFVS